MKKSQKLNERCAACTSTRFPLKARSLCRRCYPLVLKLEKIQRWNFRSPSPLAHFPKLTDYHSKNLGKGIQENYLKQIEAQLSLLKSREEKRKGNVTPFDLELAFRHVSDLAGAGFQTHYGIQGILATKLSKDARILVYSLLADIIEKTERFTLSPMKAIGAAHLRPSRSA